MVVKETEDELLEEMEMFGWWFDQDIDGENKDDNKNKLVDVQVLTFMRRDLKDSRDNIGQGRDILSRRRRVGKKRKS
nr:hypothetical protein [Tanacetum cinerariifolium]